MLTLENPLRKAKSKKETPRSGNGWKRTARIDRRPARLIKQQGILSLYDISKTLNCLPEETEKSLRVWMQGERIECLRPAASSDSPKSIYYRWRKKSDRDHLWQTRISPYRHSRQVNSYRPNDHDHNQTGSMQEKSDSWLIVLERLFIVSSIRPQRKTSIHPVTS